MRTGGRPTSRDQQALSIYPRLPVEPVMFAKLRDVSLDRIDEVIASITDDELEALYNAWIQPFALDAIDNFADPLGIPDTVDALAVLSHLYLAYIARQEVTP